MGKICNWFRKKEEKPDWVTQSREEVANEEEMAAGIHYAICEAIEEGQYLPDWYGGYDWNWKWYVKHSEAAWYIRNIGGE